MAPNVIQSPAGLGVQATNSVGFPSLSGFPTELGLGQFAVDNVGLDETLSLMYSNDDPFLVSTQVLGISLFSFDFADDDDLEISIGGGPFVAYDYDAINGFVDLSSGSSFISPGETIDFRMLGSSFAFDSFTVTGLQLELVMNPEPMSLALWGVVALCGSGGLALRRRKLTNTTA